jgi:hypothetical protein
VGAIGGRTNRLALIDLAHDRQDQRTCERKADRRHDREAQDETRLAPAGTHFYDVPDDFVSAVFPPPCELPLLPEPEPLLPPAFEPPLFPEPVEPLLPPAFELSLSPEPEPVEPLLPPTFELPLLPEPLEPLSEPDELPLLPGPLESLSSPALGPLPLPELVEPLVLTTVELPPASGLFDPPLPLLPLSVAATVGVAPALSPAVPVGLSSPAPSVVLVLPVGVLVLSTTTGVVELGADAAGVATRLRPVCPTLAPIA